MLQRCSLTIFALCLAVTAGCRTPMNTASRYSEPAPTQVLPVSQPSERVDVVPAVEQTAGETDTTSTAERLWNRIRPARRISLPRTDFWQNDDAGKVLEPVDDFDTGF